ncbi:GTP pyrophosphokinase [Aeromicrobium duanguangcaii]|uniref:GTP pyrophosphokinase family protein n=1 Tax=Aeromicrobium duanguangcaii TaxID=2968086 RepID=A0ABY5KGE5_9ACTN|nr:GTP pyrophosphokinase family protein [Aeromicrobium duanguangcaii]MCD9153355.1 GTP pyrophosphokinase family protein [Aeromicrobium duanguangcaii]MCL3836659.1 GTP pyrophosphokinase family protein [Aeromicrobium duanguangcaii]UUI69552.1 GTP pyrophosphokinase family protein [Aeromicrobium duanguangcaii]
MTSSDTSDPVDLGILRELAGTPHGPVEWRQRMRETQRQMSAFLMEYKFALDEVETKISILREEFELAHEYSPIEHVKSRLKTVESLVAKVDRIDCPRDLPTIRERIRDIAGIRVSCAFVEDTYRFATMLSQQQDLTVLETKDYIANPKPNGYRSLHLIVSLPVFLSDRTVHVPVEVQIRTIAMDFWASVEHRIYYKYRNEVPEHLGGKLARVASTAADLDAQMGRLREEIRSLS